ncbi:FkbM family methyltransferase [Candidatus Cyanaurora vandensis]|uniref:FkbM family methyltransferase n=1 Tax=Candidatus Cyanaurora vandensis TaxID=2714958 RepID=UPI002580DDDB|nr:FkbM family methyltransferase [Candidatus Cyanaurora vandensis]
MSESWERKLRNLRVAFLGALPNTLLKPVAKTSDVLHRVERYDFSILLNLNDKSISRPLLLKGSYEDHVTAVFVDHLHPDARVIDVGANIGYYSLLAASCCPQGQVYSFEPDRKNYQLLTASLAYNGYTQVQAHNLAVSEHNQTLVISDLGNAGNSGSRFTSDNKDQLALHIHGPNPYFQEIKAVSLDSFLPDVKVDVVKMDIEGHEFQALRGMVRILKEQRPILFLEFSPAGLKLVGRVEPIAMLQFLVGLGYSMGAIERGGQVHALGQDIPAILNYTTAQQVNHVDLLLT